MKFKRRLIDEDLSLSSGFYILSDESLTMFAEPWKGYYNICLVQGREEQSTYS